MLFLALLTNAQNGNTTVQDSLLEVLDKAPESLKASIHNKIAWENRNYLAEKTISHGKKAAKYAKENGNYEELAKAYSYTGVGFRNTKNFSEAFAFYNLGLSVAKKYELTQQQGYAYINLANWHLNHGNVHEAHNNLNFAKESVGEFGDSSLLGYIYLNSGKIYSKKKELTLAFEEMRKSYNLRKSNNNLRGLAVTLKYTADIYNENSLSSDSALFYYEEALELLQQVSDQALQSQILNLITQIYIDREEYIKAEKLAFKNLDYAKKGNLEANIVDAYSCLFDISMKLKKYKLANTYKDSAIFHHQKMYNKHMKTKSSRYIAEEEKEEKRTEAKLQETIMWWAISFTAVVLGALIFVFRANKQKKKTNILLKQKSNEILHKNEELETTNNEILQQKIEIENQKDIVENSNEEINQKNEELKSINEEVVAQRDEITVQHKRIKQQQYNITESIKVGEKIQGAMLTPESEIKSCLPESFVFFKPRDIVSGDFFWMTKAGNKIVITAADSTGHGVPGAFVSMLGISLLNEIVDNKGVVDAAEILEELRKQVKTSLRQSLDNDDGQDEGIDMAICVIDTDSLEMQFSGANNSIYHFRDTNLTEYKPAYCPVGIDFFEQPFKNEMIQLEEGDRVYLFSDGYMDQFGGEKGEKLMGVRFQEILSEIQTYPMAMQKIILENKLKSWQGNHKQIDDIVIFGFEMK